MTIEINFKRELAGKVGIELEGAAVYPVTKRELAIVDRNMIENLSCSRLTVTPEASAMQLEIKTEPAFFYEATRDLSVKMVALRDRLHANYSLNWAVKALASDSAPLDFYPDEPRYRHIFAGIDLELRRFVMSAMALHIHLGCTNKSSAIRVYNMLVQDIDTFIRRDYGPRLGQYIKMVPHALPRRYNSWSDFEKDAEERGFKDNTSNNHSLIRITKHGTVELRMFNASDNLEKLNKLLAYLKRFTVWV